MKVYNELLENAHLLNVGICNVAKDYYLERFNKLYGAHGILCTCNGTHIIWLCVCSLS